MTTQSYAKCTLSVETHPIEPPRPISIAVLVDGKPHGYVTIEDFQATALRLAELMASKSKVA